MDYEKQILALLSENEFLQEQMEDLNRLVKNREDQLMLMGNSADSAAYYQSRIDGNLLEIEQLKYNLAAANKKNTGMEMLNESLENDLLGVIRKDQKNEKKLREMDSVKANLSIANEELAETAVMYKKIQSLKKELAEARSNAENYRIENELLKREKKEQEDLILILQQSKKS